MLYSSFNEAWTVTTETKGSQGKTAGPVTLPYDAMLFEGRDPDCKNGQNTGWHPGGSYRFTKAFHARDTWRSQTIMLEFEGVFHRSKVYLNGHLVGGRPSGYTVFQVDLNKHLKYEQENVVEVTASTEKEPGSRWYSGSGIYRPVHLLVGGSSSYIQPYGLRVSTTSVQDGTAVIQVESRIAVDVGSLEGKSLEIKTEIRDPEGTLVATLESKAHPAITALPSTKQSITIPDAAIWSLDSPFLYTASTILSVDGQQLDQALATFGIRTISFDTKHGFRLNGVSMKLRGGALHHDNGVIGAHTLDAAEERRVITLKKAGYNAIRSSHNPISTALLRACDKHGMLVKDELTDVWTKGKVAHDYARDFTEWWERDLESMINRDFNHPSVVIYSIGNEISETANPVGIALNKVMADKCRHLDNTRPVTNAINSFLNMIAPKTVPLIPPPPPDDDEAPNHNMIVILNYMMGFLDWISHWLKRLPACDTSTRAAYADVDIAGYNYAYSRYNTDVVKYPNRIILGTESSSYHLAEAWQLVIKHPQVIGDFVWTEWDYLGEAGFAAPLYDARLRITHPWPALACGTPVIDITGHRLTQSYVNEFIWGLRSGVHIAVHPLNHWREKLTHNSWTPTDSISSWNWPDFVGVKASIEVWSDAPTVELTLNGNSLGRKRAGVETEFLAKYQVPYEPGVLEAVGFDSDGREIGRQSLSSGRDTLTLKALPEKPFLLADGMDLLYIPFELNDNNGILIPFPERDISVIVEGAAVLLGFGNGNPRSPESLHVNEHSTYYGRALVVIRAGHQKGSVRITAETDGCKVVELDIPVV